MVSQIPTAVIADQLLGTSYRILNSISIMESLRTTKSKASEFVVTAISTLVIDLIWGLTIGIALHVLLTRYSKKP